MLGLPFMLTLPYTSVLRVDISSPGFFEEQVFKRANRSGREVAAVQIQRAIRGWRARVWAVKMVYDRDWRALVRIQVQTKRRILRSPTSLRAPHAGF